MCVGRRAILEIAFDVGIAKFAVDHVLHLLNSRFSGNLGSQSAVVCSSVRKLVCNIKKRWEVAKRVKKVFLHNNDEWLDGDYCLPQPLCRDTSGPSGKTFPSKYLKVNKYVC